MIFLRYDIDYSVEWELRFAKINKEIGIAGTFTFELRCPLYNLFAYENIKKIHQVAELGQEIGLHFILPNPLPSTNDELAEMIQNDFEAMKKILPMTKPVFAWHNPTSNPDNFQRLRDFKMKELVNMYSSKFFGDIPYYSDSSIQHSPEDFKRFLKKGDNQIQLLFHPLEWITEEKDWPRILIKTWHQILKEHEAEFLTNFDYKKSYPKGLFNNIKPDSFKFMLTSLQKSKKVL